MNIQPKVFNDPIHGSLELHPLLVKIIDTPQFQRLRYIKQLGGKCYVYPGATHTRFEHSIGVAYLAGELVKALHEKNLEDMKNPNKKEVSDLNITPADILCVQIAGLCHDLGHGPFSHMYDGMFIHKIEPSWKHETASLNMFDYLVNENNLKDEMRSNGLKLPNDLEFIKELIDPKNWDEDTEKWPFKGRDKNKSFLYDIVANKRNGIDVDKWDYFARDCHYLGIKSSFDYRRLIMFARVCEWNGRREICFRDKEVFNLYDMFYTRYSLHRRAYQHKVANSIEWMITDAFLKADQHIQIEGTGGETKTLSEAKNDMVAYTKLTDTIFDQILNSSSQDLQGAREVLDRIMRRKLYLCLGEFQSQPLDDIKAKWNELIQGGNPDDYVVELVTFNYGKGPNDPIQHVRFYNKQNTDAAKPITRAEVSHLLPQKFEEKLFRIYTKRTNEEHLRADKERFETFCSQITTSTLRK